MGEKEEEEEEEKEREEERVMIRETLWEGSSSGRIQVHPVHKVAGSSRAKVSHLLTLR